jgi:prefoldin subunit 5
MLTFSLERMAEIDQQLRALAERVEALERRMAEIDEHEPEVGGAIEAMQWHLQQLIDAVENIEAERQ